MRDRAVLDSGVIFALYFEEDASLRAEKAANEYSPITLDLAGQAYEIALENKTKFYDSLFLAAALQEKVPLLTLDKKMYVAAKAKNNVQML
jgi:predicted nucleic acid-binding protein